MGGLHRKFAFLLLTLFFVFSTIGIIIGFLSPQIGNRFWSQLVDKINEGQKTIFLHELTNYDWDTVCVMPPYALNVGGPGARVNRYIKADLGEFKDKFPNQNGDGAWAFAFIKNGVVVAIEKRGRGPGIDTDYSDNCIRKIAATFVFEDNYIRDNDYLIITDHTASEQGEK